MATSYTCVASIRESACTIMHMRVTTIASIWEGAIHVCTAWTRVRHGLCIYVHCIRQFPPQLLFEDSSYFFVRMLPADVILRKIHNDWHPMKYDAIV